MADGGSFAEMTAFTPDQESQRDYRDALGAFATGVTVVTCASDRGPLGITANSFASVSLDPPLVLWSPAKTSHRFEAFASARRFAIHILGEEQAHICRHFASQGLDFSGLDWFADDQGLPLIRDCLARFTCTHFAAHDGGDHLIIVGHVDEAERRAGAPLVFASGRYGRFTDAF